MATSDEPRDEPQPSLALAVLSSPILLTGGYAWAISVGPTALHALFQLREAGLASRPALSLLASSLALLALLLGVILERLRRPAAPFVGIWGFLLLLALAWLVWPAAIDVARLDPLRGALGSGGFALFALAWGVPDVLRRLIPEDNPRADTSSPLEAREQLPWAALGVASLGILAASLLFFYAWKVHDSPRALFGRALAALASIALISISAQVAVLRRGYLPASAGARLRRASLAIFLLGLLVLVGVAQALLLRLFRLQVGAALAGA